MSALADLRGFAPNRRAAPDFAPNLERLKSTRDAAGPLGLTLVPAEARGLDALEQAFATMIGERAQALTVLSDGGAVQLSSHSGRRSDRIEPLFAAVHESAVDPLGDIKRLALPINRGQPCAWDGRKANRQPSSFSLQLFTTWVGLFLPLPLVLSGEAVVGVRAYCR